MQVQDRELEKGRRNDDSSSSRGSSPQPGPRRSFTPTSDDGSTIPPMADDDTPPPQDRPLIRRPMAFAAAMPTASNINTYEASSMQPTANAFLPGQAVPISKQPRNLKKNGGSKKVKHYNDAFASQTGRWRAQSYDPTPSITPSTYSEDGPYRSSFRAPVTQVQQSAASTSTSSFVAVTPANLQATVDGHEPAALPSSSSVMSKVPAKKVRAPRASRKAAKGKGTQANRSVGVGGTSNPPDVSPEPPPSAGQNSISGSSATAKSFSPASQIQSSPSVVSPTERHAMSATAGIPSSQPHVPNSQAESESQRRNRSLPVLTVLIQDERNGRTDFLLSEVRVPLKRAERVEDGWWADAKDVCEKLQNGPSRIDGPAKVYTLRGKFRQFFLKVTADNKDEWESANLVVSPQRTLDVFVESPIHPGQYPYRMAGSFGAPSSPGVRRLESPPQSSRDARDYRSSVASGCASSDYYHRHKRRRSSSFEDYRHGSPGPRPHPSQPVRSPSYRDATLDSQSSAVPPKRQRHYAKGSLDHIMIDQMDTSDEEARPPPPPRGFRTPSPDADEDEIHDMVSKSISPLLEQEPSWTDFFQWKAAPPTASTVLKQYRWVKRMMDEWVGKTAPLKSRSFQVEETHVLAALRLEDKWGEACKETLSLLELYGPEGKHLQDPRVNIILEDNSIPTYNAKPIKRLLHLLRDIHEDYKKERLAVAQPVGEDSDTDILPSSSIVRQ